MSWLYKFQVGGLALWRPMLCFPHFDTSLAEATPQLVSPEAVGLHCRRTEGWVEIDEVMVLLADQHGAADG